MYPTYAFKRCARKRFETLFLSALSLSLLHSQSCSACGSASVKLHIGGRPHLVHCQEGNPKRNDEPDFSATRVASLIALTPSIEDARGDHAAALRPPICVSPWRKGAMHRRAIDSRLTLKPTGPIYHNGGRARSSGKIRFRETLPRRRADEKLCSFNGK